MQKVSFSYKYFNIFVDRVVDVFSQSDVSGQAMTTQQMTDKQTETEAKIK